MFPLIKDICNNIFALISTVILIPVKPNAFGTNMQILEE